MTVSKPLNVMFRGSVKFNNKGIPQSYLDLYVSGRGVKEVGDYLYLLDKNCTLVSINLNLLWSPTTPVTPIINGIEDFAVLDFSTQLNVNVRYYCLASSGILMTKHIVGSADDPAESVNKIQMPKSTLSMGLIYTAIGATADVVVVAAAGKNNEYVNYFTMRPVKMSISTCSAAFTVKRSRKGTALVTQTISLRISLCQATKISLFVSESMFSK